MDFPTQDTLYQIADIIGLVGVGFYLTSYTLLQFGHVKGGTAVYTAMNLTAASFVLISLTSRFNFSSLLIQLFWISVSLYTLVKLYGLHRARRGTERDRYWARKLLPQLSEKDGAAVLSVGELIETREDLMLLRQGAPVRAMYLMAEGSASIAVDGEIVRVAGPGDFLGEFGIWDGEDASATVRVTAAGRIYRFDRKDFLAHLKSDANLEVNIHRLMRRFGIERLNRSHQAYEPVDEGQETARVAA